MIIKCLKHLAEDFQSIENQESQNNGLSYYFNTLAVDEVGNIIPYGYNVSKKWAFHNISASKTLRQSFIDVKTPLLKGVKEVVHQSIAYLHHHTNIKFANATNIIESISYN